VAGYDRFRSIGPVMANVHAAGLRAALRRCALGAELPLLADGSSDPEQKHTTDRYQKGGS